MTAEALAEGLAAAARMRRDELLDLAERVAAGGGVELRAAPEPANVMLELETALGAFCLGEAVVTRCAVSVAGREGAGCVLGYDREGALATALVATDLAGAEPLAVAALVGERRAAEREAAAVAETKVAFG